MGRQDQSTRSTSHRKNRKPRSKPQRFFLFGLIFIVAALAISLLVIILNKENGLNIFHHDSPDFPEPIYSVMTGKEIEDATLNTSPTFCVQIPNGTDGGRPQVGLTEAAVVFEAIAEAGITRFAAVFQNPTSSAIGPVRSLRPYYLDWDTPFDCTVVHAGGSDEALYAINMGGHRDLDESLTYMWRETGTGRLWNNLFTSPADMLAFNQAKGYNTSNPKAFPRQNPDDVATLLRERNECAEAEANAADNASDNDADQSDACPAETLITDIRINFGNSTTFNTAYKYDAETNTYLRSYASGAAHEVYLCPADLTEPNTKTQCGSLIQVAPSVIVAMRVKESKMADNYHEQITTIGSGDVTIFQNGLAIQGTWSKASQSEQIVFRDTEGNEIRLTPGQVWVAAVPQYGSVKY